MSLHIRTFVIAHCGCILYLDFGIAQMEIKDVISRHEPFIKKQIVEEIDIVQCRSSLFRLNDFFYNPSDCLFDSFSILFHFQYTSIQIQEGVVKHFQHCLKNRDKDALQS